MSTPSPALVDPLIEQSVNKSARRVSKVLVFLSVIGFGCVLFWALGNDEQEQVDVDPTVSMAVLPMQLPNLRLPIRPAIQVQAKPQSKSKYGSQKYWKAAERGTTKRPRLSVHKTNNHIYAQLIDDQKEITLASMSTIQEGMKGMKRNKETGRILGEKIGDLALEKGITEAVFDRAGYKYHGIIKEIAEGARSKGLLDNVNPNRAVV